MTLNAGTTVLFFCIGFFFGFLTMSQFKGSDMRRQERLFENCLEWKKDFDWCRKEFML